MNEFEFYVKCFAAGLAGQESAGCIEYNVDLAGSDLEDGTIRQVDSFKECQQHCARTQGCNFWSWTPASFAADQKVSISISNNYLLSNCMQVCQLKASDAGRARPSGKISGPRRCSGAGSGPGPLFLQLSLQLARPPLQGRHQAALTELDTAVSDLVTILQARGLWENTLLVFLSTAGATVGGGGSNWPLRGGAGAVWEGGGRTPALLAGPRLPPVARNSRSTRLFHVTDWAATLLAAAGVRQPPGMDGGSHWAGLLDPAAAPARTEIVYTIQQEPPTAAIRVGDYKLVVGAGGPGEWTAPPEEHSPNSGSGNEGSGAEEEEEDGPAGDCVEQDVNLAGHGISDNRVEQARQGSCMQ